MQESIHDKKECVFIKYTIYNYDHVFLCVIACCNIRSLSGQRTDYCANNPCENGGSCSRAMGKANCSCPTGYEGTNCEKKFGMYSTDYHHYFLYNHTYIITTVLCIITTV